MSDTLLPATERARRLLKDIWGVPRGSDDVAVAAYIIREERQAVFETCTQIVRDFAWMLPDYKSWSGNDAAANAAQSVSKQLANAVAARHRAMAEQTAAANHDRGAGGSPPAPNLPPAPGRDDSSIEEPLRDLQRALQDAVVCLERLLDGQTKHSSLS